MKIYADNAATTKMCPAAIEAMLPFLDRIYGNPSSLHSVGQEAAEALADTVPEALPLSDRWDDLCTLALVLGQRR